MKLCIILVLLKFCFCSKYEFNIPPVSYESKLAKYDRYYDDRPKLSYEEDMELTDGSFEKYTDEKQKYGRRQKRETDEDTNEMLDKIFGYTGPTANDEPENLIRPCSFDDWQCIRNYFAANGKCKPSYGPIPDPLYVDIATAYLPLTNMTVALPDMQIRGLSNARIRNFYVNKKSGNLVFAFDVQNLNMTIPRAYLRYRRTAKESIVLADYGTVNYRSITFTAVIPRVGDLRLDQADVHADIQDSTPPFFVGPGASASADPDVVTAFTQLIAGLPFSLREGLLFQSQLYAAIYIQSNICDFGLKFVCV